MCNYKCKTCGTDPRDCIQCSDGDRELSNDCHCRDGMLDDGKNPGCLSKYSILYMCLPPDNLINIKPIPYYSNINIFKY